MQNRIRANLLVAALLVGASSPGYAQSTATGSFDVLAEVIEVCEVTATNLNFGEYNVADAAPTDSQSDLELICTGGTGYDIALNGGTTTGLVNDRAMESGGNRLSYQLFTDAARTNPWGEQSPTNTVVGTFNSPTSLTIPVYGRIPARLLVPAGLYQDTVTVTVSY